MNPHAGERKEAPFWVNGEMLFRVVGTRGESDRLARVDRPFALLGRSEGLDITLAERSVSARHTYLHLDPRGVYAVDLLTRTGTRINGTDAMVGWLQPGDRIEVGGRQVELVRARINGTDIAPMSLADDLLSESNLNGLPGLTLLPRREGDSPWVLGSELVFLGWSASCGIQIKDASLARAHCALVRTPGGVFLVDLCGEKTKVEGRQIQGATALQDGNSLTLGSTDFTVRVQPPPRVSPRTLPARIEAKPPVFDPEVLPPETQNAMLAWMMGTVQGSQGELLRQQGEFQVEVTQALRQIQQDNATLLNAHLSRIEKIDRELASLRAEIERREIPNGLPAKLTPVLPTATPLNIARPATREPEPAGSRTSTTWLLSRVSQLEEENRSAWKDLAGRIGPSRKEA